jgi:hypothetical protein
MTSCCSSVSARSRYICSNRRYRSRHSSSWVCLARTAHVAAWRLKRLAVQVGVPPSFARCIAAYLRVSICALQHFYYRNATLIRFIHQFPPFRALFVLIGSNDHQNRGIGGVGAHPANAAPNYCFRLRLVRIARAALCSGSPKITNASYTPETIDHRLGLIKRRALASDLIGLVVWFLLVFLASAARHH